MKHPIETRVTDARHYSLLTSDPIKEAKRGATRAGPSKSSFSLCNSLEPNYLNFEAGPFAFRSIWHFTKIATWAGRATSVQEADEGHQTSRHKLKLFTLCSLISFANKYIDKFELHFLSIADLIVSWWMVMIRIFFFFFS